MTRIKKTDKKRALSLIENAQKDLAYTLSLEVHENSSKVDSLNQSWLFVLIQLVIIEKIQKKAFPNRIEL